MKILIADRARDRSSERRRDSFNRNFLFDFANSRFVLAYPTQRQVAIRLVITTGSGLRRLREAYVHVHNRGNRDMLPGASCLQSFQFMQGPLH